MLLGSKTLYPHQVAAIEWMMKQENEPIHGGFLCDDMGLGKTWTVLGLLNETAADCPRTLLLCPLVVAEQWAVAGAEAGFTVYVYSKGRKWTKRNNGVSANAGPGPSLYIANYERIKENETANLEFDRLVIDEAHNLRNQESERYKKIYNLAKEVPRTWCVTGTPLVNHHSDIEALYRLVRGNRSDSIIGDFAKACEVFSSYAIGRSMEDIGMPLGPRPADKHVVLDFDTAEEADFYRLIQGQVARQLTLYEELDVGNSLAMFKLLLRLRQISIHPQVYIEGQRRTHRHNYGRADWTGKSSTKVRGLIDLIEGSETGHNWVVFCNFQDEIELLRAELVKSRYIRMVKTYHGKTQMGERLEDLAEYKGSCANTTNLPYWPKEGRHRGEHVLCDILGALPYDVCGLLYDYLMPGHNVLLVQIHCGGTGLNLQENDRVVFMSPWWTAALMNQAIGRVYRMGQKKQVEVYRLMLKEEASLNIDKKMMESALRKEGLCAELLRNCVRP